MEPTLEPNTRLEPGPGEGAGALLSDLEARCEAIGARLRSAATPVERGEVKQEILDLFREVDALHESVGRVRERIRGLVEEYRTAGGGAGAGRRASVHSDGLNSSTFVERGWNLIAAEKHVEAVGALEKALALSPDNLEAEGLLGWALMKAGRLERALTCLQRVLLSDPSNAMARVNLGYICLKKRIYGEALAHLSGAIEAGGDRKATIYALNYLGLMHAERENVDEALACFKGAIEAGPNLIEAYYHMGFLLYRQGRLEEARTVWRSAVAQNAYSPHAKRARAALAELEAGRPVEAAS